MKLDSKQYLAIVRALHQLDLAQTHYLRLMDAVGLNGNLPHIFNDETLEITPRDPVDPPLVQPT